MKPRFISPPHPSPHSKITPRMLDDFEKSKTWIAQRKFNGSNAVIWLFEDQIAMWNRYGEPFKNYRIPDSMKRCFFDLDREYETEYVFNGELLHTKAKSKITKEQSIENTIVLFDILHVDKPLNLTTIERLNLLFKIASPQGHESEKRALTVNECKESRLWLAETFYDDFKYRFYEMYDFNEQGLDKYPEIEGLMLKLKDNKNMKNFMTRCRKLKDNLYMF